MVKCELVADSERRGVGDGMKTGKRKGRDWGTAEG